ncbi:MAG: YbaB/EbfC family nucleoid-associated protein [Bacteroidota bacterium]
MFSDLFGNMQERQEALRKQLGEIEISAEAGDGAVRVSANARREITNITIDPDKMDWEDKEAVEDLLLVAINRALQEAAAKEAEASQNLIKDIMPPGMGDLGNLFG